MVTFFLGSYASVCDLKHIQNDCERKCTVRYYTNQASYFCHVTNILEKEGEKLYGHIFPIRKLINPVKNTDKKRNHTFSGYKTNKILSDCGIYISCFTFLLDKSRKKLFLQNHIFFGLL